MPDAFTQTRHEQMAVVDDRGSLPGIAGASQRYAGASVAPRVLILLAGHGGGDLPGATALAVMPYWLRSSASVLIRPPRPCLAAS